MKIGIVVFPGSNCDHDAWYAINENAKSKATFLWHKDTTIPNNIECIILPGGFSFGDYLRCGAIAKFSPIMNEVFKFAKNGKYILGICNGFQILTETGLLPGTLLRNHSLNFICKDVFLKVNNNSTPFTSLCNMGQILKIPVAHGEGNYFASNEVIEELETDNRVVFRYSSKDGDVNLEHNPNGSINNIAGIISKEGNILGMMPHPERCCDGLLGNDDGLFVINSLIKNLS